MTGSRSYSKLIDPGPEAHPDAWNRLIAASVPIPSPEDILALFHSLGTSFGPPLVPGGRTMDREIGIQRDFAPSRPQSTHRKKLGWQPLKWDRLCLSAGLAPAPVTGAPSPSSLGGGGSPHPSSLGGGGSPHPSSLGGWWEPHPSSLGGGW